jgi:hypothetical protein
MSWVIIAYWNCAPPWRPPPRRSCAENNVVCTPSTFSSGARRRAITSSDDMCRSDNGFRLTVRLPRLIALQPFDTPTVDPTLATAGSRRITSTAARWRSSIAWNDTSGDARVEPIRMPVSCSGRNPFGSTV